MSIYTPATSGDGKGAPDKRQIRITAHAYRRIHQRLGSTPSAIAELFSSGITLPLGTDLAENRAYALIYDQPTATFAVAVTDADASTLITVLSLEHACNNRNGYLPSPHRMIALAKQSGERLIDFYLRDDGVVTHEPFPVMCEFFMQEDGGLKHVYFDSTFAFRAQLDPTVSGSIGIQCSMLKTRLADAVCEVQRRYGCCSPVRLSLKDQINRVIPLSVPKPLASMSNEVFLSLRRWATESEEAVVFPAGEAA